MLFFLTKGSGCDIIAKGRSNESNDLLHEIDKALRVGKGFLLEQGALAILWQLYGMHYIILHFNLYRNAL